MKLEISIDLKNYGLQLLLQNSTVKLTIIGTTSSLPNWATTMVSDYCKRIPSPHSLTYQTLKSVGGRHSSRPENMHKDGENLLCATTGTLRVCLDSQGPQFSSQEFANQLKIWHQQNSKITFLIGGAYGHSPTSIAQADQTWSLGKLTYNHPLVFMLVAEQLYRGICIINNHPYAK
jgi:23S rRNA (pseudouridine1915-N3)-methyltransferase